MMLKHSSIFCFSLALAALASLESCKKSDEIHCKKCKECQFDATDPKGYDDNQCGEYEVYCGDAKDRAEQIPFFVCEERD